MPLTHSCQKRKKGCSSSGTREPAPFHFAFNKPRQLNFYNDLHWQKFEKVRNFPRRPTKFPDMQAFAQLGIETGIRQLFRNIGWEKLLDKSYTGYIDPTLEFIVTAHVDKTVLHFQMHGKDRKLSYTQINDLIQAPTENTFGPTDQKDPAYSGYRFWRTITGISGFIGGRTKASHIAHPVLKVAYRILACLVFSSEEPSMISGKEMYLLWCMTQERDQKPNFGSYLCHYLLKLDHSPTPSTMVVCGGIVTLLCHHPSILPFPLRSVPIQGNISLGIPQLQKLKMLSIEGSYYNWLRGRIHERYPCIHRDDINILALSSPTENTQWLLPGRKMAPMEEDIHDDKPMDDSGVGPSASHPPPPCADTVDYGWMRDHMLNLEASQAQLLANQARLRADFAAKCTLDNTQYDHLLGLLTSIHDCQQRQTQPPPPQ